MPDFVIHDAMRHEDWGPVVDPAECKHPGHCQIPVGLDTSQGEMRARAVFCAACGRELFGQRPWGEALAELVQENDQFLSILVRMHEVGQALADAGMIVVRVPEVADEFYRQLWEERNLAPASWCHWSDEAA